MDDKPIHDPGYDWSAPSAQGEVTLTPEVRALAAEILKIYWEAAAADRRDIRVMQRERRLGRLRRFVRRLRDSQGETIQLSLSGLSE